MQFFSLTTFMTFGNQFLEPWFCHSKHRDISTQPMRLVPQSSSMGCGLWPWHMAVVNEETVMMVWGWRRWQWPLFLRGEVILSLAQTPKDKDRTEWQRQTVLSEFFSSHGCRTWFGWLSGVTDTSMFKVKGSPKPTLTLKYGQFCFACSFLASSPLQIHGWSRIKCQTNVLNSLAAGVRGLVMCLLL